MGATTKLSWRVEGMDCASCVAKVTKAVERLPGVSAVEVNLMAERLTLELGHDGRAEAVEAQVASLGYATRRMAEAGSASAPPPGCDCGHGHGHDSPGDHTHDAAPPPAHGHDYDSPADAGKPWWRTGKAMLVWTLGALVLGAYALSLVLPERLTYPLFLIATLVALVPFGRRAIALARSGSPFSIETLMCTAAIGAAIIGAAEEAAVVVLLFAVGELLGSGPIKFFERRGMM